MFCCLSQIMNALAARTNEHREDAVQHVQDNEGTQMMCLLKDTSSCCLCPENPFSDFSQLLRSLIHSAPPKWLSSINHSCILTTVSTRVLWIRANWSLLFKTSDLDHDDHMRRTYSPCVLFTFAMNVLWCSIYDSHYHIITVTQNQNNKTKTKIVACCLTVSLQSLLSFRGG